MKAVIAYAKKLRSSTFVPSATKLSEELELKRKLILKSFSVARNIYKSDSQIVANEVPSLKSEQSF